MSDKNFDMLQVNTEQFTIDTFKSDGGKSTYFLIWTFLWMMFTIALLVLYRNPWYLCTMIVWFLFWSLGLEQKRTYNK